jgi:excisionase family DNA binding protein
VTRNPPDAFEDLVRRIVREELAALAPAAPASEYLTPAEAAEIARVSSPTIRRWVTEGRLPGHGTDRALRIRRAELEAFLAARRSRPRRAATTNLSPEALARHRLG